LLLIQELGDDILQKIAKEMNLSDTAFIFENEHNTYSKGTDNRIIWLISK